MLYHRGGFGHLSDIGRVITLKKIEAEGKRAGVHQVKKNHVLYPILRDIGEHLFGKIRVWFKEQETVACLHHLPDEVAKDSCFPCPCCSKKDQKLAPCFVADGNGLTMGIGAE